jgi:phytoene/squalene synthetase
MKHSTKLSPCAQQAYESDRDRFLQSLFVPEPARSELLTLVALDVELRRIHKNVSEEMIGHIRYAWWYEKIEALYESKQTPGHPVLEALAPLISLGYLPQPALLAFIETYRAHFPELPHDSDARLDHLLEQLVEAISPQSKPRWDRAGQLIIRHRTRHGLKRNSWLSIKLMFLK